MLQAVPVDLVVAFIDGEVKAVCSIYLDVQEPWAEEFILVSYGYKIFRPLKAICA
jgi:hypothetical protein